MRRAMRFVGVVLEATLHRWYIGVPVGMAVSYYELLRYA